MGGIEFAVSNEQEELPPVISEQVFLVGVFCNVFPKDLAVSEVEAVDYSASAR